MFAYLVSVKENFHNKKCFLINQILQFLFSFFVLQGDSGGPMVVKGNRGQYMLVGLISWGMGCALPKQPGVYTRITKFVNWIDEIIWQ